MGGALTRGWRFKPSEHPTMGFGRFGSFADAIYAIAATILVLELRIPEHVEPGHMGDVLTDLGPHYVIYGLGAAFVLMGWIQTRRIDSMVVGLDHYSTLLQIAALFVFALTPFLAKVVTRGLEHPADLPTAVRFTALILFAAMVPWGGCLVYFKKKGMYRKGLDAEVFNAYYGKSALWFIPPAIAWGVSYMSAPVALAILIAAYLIPLLPVEPRCTSTDFMPSRRLLPERGWFLGGWRFSPRDHALYSFDRLGALVDGVYAIVATLIVLELHLPETTGPGGLAEGLREITPQYVAYGLGLVFALGGWLQPRRVALWFRGVDHYATLFVLGAVCTYILTPFIAVVLAHSLDDQADLAAAVRVTAVIQLITVLLWQALFAYAARRDLFVDELDPDVFGLYRALVKIFPVMPVAAFALSFVAPTVAFGFVVAYFLGVLLPAEAHSPHATEDEVAVIEAGGDRVLA